jgi:hypothetical protein
MWTSTRQIMNDRSWSLAAIRANLDGMTGLDQLRTMLATITEATD